MKYLAPMSLFLVGCAMTVVPVDPKPSFEHEMGACKIKRSDYYRTVHPEYPERAKKSGQEGWVIFKYDIEDGYIKNIKVLGSSPRNVFERASIAALEESRYKPGFYQPGCVVLVEFNLE